MAGVWNVLPSAPAAISTMLLLTDGSVMSHERSTPHWWRLTPDTSGDYARGLWVPLASLPALPSGSYAPLYFASAVLRDGRVIVAGGEYNNNVHADVLAAAVYDSAQNTWMLLPTPSGWVTVGDAPCCVLADGRLLLGSIQDSRTAIYDPGRGAWTPAGNKRNRTSTEETWTLLPDDTVLTADCSGHPEAEKYVPTTDSWVSAGVVPIDLVEAASIEIGPALLLPDGRVFAMGATGNTALYLPPAIATASGNWVAGPTFPTIAGTQLGAKDAPAALLPNGRVLCAVGPVTGNAGDYLGPTYCFEFDSLQNAVVRVADPPTSGLAPYEMRMMLLPTGQVLLSNGTSQVAVYTPDDKPQEAWRPRITACATTLVPGQTYQLIGEQLNGLSQAVSYGDDAAMATNYPLVRLDRPGEHHYLRTANHSSMAVHTDTRPQSTFFTVPHDLAVGPAQLLVIANGIATLPLPVNVAAQVTRRRVVTTRGA